MLPNNPANFPYYIINTALPLNTGTPDANNCYWYLETLTGWASPDARVTMIPRISADGEIPADLHYRGRTVVVSGWVECPDEASRQAARYLLTAAMDLIYYDGLFLAQETDPKQLVIVHAGNAGQGAVTFEDNGRGFRTGQMLATVNPRMVTDAQLFGSGTVTSATANFAGGDVGSPVWALGGGVPIGSMITAVTDAMTATIDPPPPNTIGPVTFGIGAPGGVGAVGGPNPGVDYVYLAKFSVEMYSRDPRKYSPTLTDVNFSGGDATCVNVGNTGTGPQILITTAANDPIGLVNNTTGQMLVLHAISPLTMPATVLVDFNAKTIIDAGTSANRYDLRSLVTPWWVLGPGSTIVATSPALAGTVTFVSAWI